MPVTLIGEAVFARCLSALKDERVRASKILKGPAVTKYGGDKTQFIDDIRQVGNNSVWGLIHPFLGIVCF